MIGHKESEIKGLGKKKELYQLWGGCRKRGNREGFMKYVNLELVNLGFVRGGTRNTFCMKCSRMTSL